MMLKPGPDWYPLLLTVCSDDLNKWSGVGFVQIKLVIKSHILIQDAFAASGVNVGGGKDNF